MIKRLFAQVVETISGPQAATAEDREAALHVPALQQRFGGAAPSVERVGRCGADASGVGRMTRPSRWSATSSATKALMGTGKLFLWVFLWLQLTVQLVQKKS